MGSFGATRFSGKYYRRIGPMFKSKLPQHFPHHLSQRRKSLP